MRRELLGCLLAGGLLLPAAAAAQTTEAAPGAAEPEAPAAVEPAPVPAPVYPPLHAAPQGAAGGGGDMRMMTVAMGAMAGYMLIAMPVTLPAIAAGAVGGLAARYWYDRRLPAER